jgi:hypothetical protein
MLYFHRTTDKGIVVVNNVLKTKEVTLNGKKRIMSVQMTDLKFGFFACENPDELGFQPGDKVPVVIVEDAPILDKNGKHTNLYWCNPA